MELTLLEAKNRIGGRILTDHQWGFPIDLGASWIHGSNKNPLNKIAENYHLELTSTDYKNVRLYDQQGKMIEKEKHDHALNIFNSIHTKLLNAIEDPMNQISMEKAIAKYTSDPKKNDPLHWFIMDYITSSGAQLDQIAYPDFFTDSEFSGKDKLINYGFEQLIINQCQSLNIYLNQKVVKIELNPDHVLVETQDDIYIGKLCLLTISLGVLQSFAASIYPPLPRVKTKSINRLKMGFLNKIILQFDQVSWPPEIESFGFLSADKFSSPFVLNYFPIIKKPILVAFVYGNQAFQMETQDENDIIAQVISQLKKAFPELPDKPKRSCVKNWASDPEFAGSYSYVPVGADSDDYDVIAEPFLNKLFFAGEATHKKYRGTAHGAFLSGKREAKNILKLIKG